MKTLKYALFFFLWTLISCGQQLVELPIDGSQAQAPSVTFTDPTLGATGVEPSVELHASFSTAMDATSLNGTSFTLTQGSVAIPGTVSYDGAVATLLPSAPLSTNSLFTATITTAAKSTAGLALVADYSWTFTTREGTSADGPSVIFTSPNDLASGVPTSAKIGAAFSEPMAPESLDTTSFTLSQAGATVAGTISYAGTTAIFSPSAPLADNATFTATITTAATDTSGDPLAADYVWTFTTSAETDVTDPFVLFTSPVSDAFAVPVSTTIQVAFNENMDCTTLDSNSFSLLQGAVAVLGNVTCVGSTATFTPSVALAPNADYLATVTTGARDLSGNALASDYLFSFSTSADPDTTAPSVTFTNPPNNANGVDVATSVQAAFDEVMDCVTLDITTFSLKQGVSPVLGTVTCVGAVATFHPVSPLVENSGYTATITSGAQDLAGNALANDYVWNFLTGQVAGQMPVDLGVASSYAILAFDTVTNVNNVGTIVTGDLGISPGAALVGFPPGVINGATHLGDATAANAKAALLTAYNDAAGRLGAAVLPADLSGLTLAPGLYKNSTSVMIAAGNLTLDAQGDVNAVFIFQMGSTLTTLAGTQVILAGGAKATNVYWAVGTSATLGTNSIFKGTILAASAITMTTGATLEGRLLAQGATVALDKNVITVPSP